jgi:cytoskeletal protein CcmA (bactofilin family)
MFGRGTDQKTDDQRSARLTTPPGTREATAVTVSQGLGLPPRAADDSVIAAEDHFEGTLKTSRGVRILGTVDGTIESASHVHIEQSAKVSADVTAEEVVISGQYSGKLVCRQRLEVQPTGRVNGNIETVKLMLHEGGYVDGELHMQKPGQAAEAPRPSEGGVRPIGAMRSTVEPSIRQSASSASASGNGPAEPEASAEATTTSGGRRSE